MQLVVDSVVQGWRLLRRQPGLALAAVTALAMGIGFTTTMFGIVHGGTRALPFDEPDEIVLVQQARGSGTVPIRPHVYREWSASLSSFEGIGGWQSGGVNVSGDGAPDRVPAVTITPGAFKILGVSAALGRTLVDADAEASAPPVALVSHIVWQSRFGGDPSIVGRAIRLNGVPHEIVGVMPRGFGFPINARIWTPLRVEPAEAPRPGTSIEVFARLKDGATAERAESELAVVTARMAERDPQAFDRVRARVLPFLELETPRQVQLGLQVLVLAVSLAFVVACANVANLLLARAAARSRDLAVQSALGAGRGRLVAGLLGESALLAAIACALGLLMASAGLRFFAAASAGVLEAFWVDFRIDATVVAFATTLGLCAALAAGLVPALRATSSGSNSLLRGEGLGATGIRLGRLGRVLVVGQLALACGLLALTATFVRASASIRSVDLVFPAHQILTTSLSVPGPLLADPDDRERLLVRLRDEFHAAAGDTAFVTSLPGRGAGNDVFTFADESDPTRRTTGVVLVTPEFFALAGASARQGRLIAWQDTGHAPRVAVVNESFAAKFSAARDAVGRRIRIGALDFEVAGVVGDLRMQDPEDADGAGIYLSMLQARPSIIRSMTATRAAPVEAVPAVRAAVARVDPDLPVLEPASLHDAIYADKGILDAMAALFLAFGLGTVFMALIGLFAVLSFTVTARTREFGIRMALGASPADILRLVIRRGAIELVWGLGIGLVVAFAISQALSATLEQVPPGGPPVFIAIAVTIVTGAALALWRPIRRAVGLSAAEALRR